MSEVKATGQYEDLFDRPLSEYSDEELLEMSNEIRTKRKYPAVEKKGAREGDAIDKLIGKFAIKTGDNNGSDSEEASDTDS